MVQKQGIWLLYDLRELDIVEWKITRRMLLQRQNMLNLSFYYPIVILLEELMFHISTHSLIFANQ